MNEQDTYHGFTIEDIKASFDYNPVCGKFINKRTGNLVYDFKINIRNPDGKTVTLMLPRVAVWLVDGRLVAEGYVVKFKDTNHYNLAYDNLVVVPAGEVNKPTDNSKFVETATKGVFYNQETRVFVVRRGAKQAIYRTLDYKVAVAIRKEWELDKTVHRWDNSLPDWVNFTKT